MPESLPPTDGVRRRNLARREEPGELLTPGIGERSNAWRLGLASTGKMGRHHGRSTHRFRPLIAIENCAWRRIIENHRSDRRPERYEERSSAAITIITGVQTFPSTRLDHPLDAKVVALEKSDPTNRRFASNTSRAIRRRMPPATSNIPTSIRWSK